MANKLLALDANALDRIVETLTPPRLSKYLAVTQRQPGHALRLYILNTKVSAAMMVDLHYVEIALRNRFARELAARFGNEWFMAPAFLALLDKRSQDILFRARKDAGKHTPAGQAPPTGKVIAELTFGFWLQLTDSRLEHSLWVPCLHKAFAPRKAPKRSTFNQQLEKLRQLRNRIAHHEPIFHLDLGDARRRIVDVAALLCPTTAAVMANASSVRRTAMGLTRYRRRRGF